MTGNFISLQLDTELYGLQNRSESDGEEKNT
jgi:hypothetical protein